MNYINPAVSEISSYRQTSRYFSKKFYNRFLNNAIVFNFPQAYCKPPINGFLSVIFHKEIRMKNTLIMYYWFLIISHHSVQSILFSII